MIDRLVVPEYSPLLRQFMISIEGVEGRIIIRERVESNDMVIVYYPDITKFRTFARFGRSVILIHDDMLDVASVINQAIGIFEITRDFRRSFSSLRLIC